MAPTPTHPLETGIDLVTKKLTAWVAPLATVAFSILIAAPALRSTVAHGQDLPFHLFRSFGTVNAWADGQLVAQVDPQAFGGFGLGTDIFYSPLSAWITSATYLLVHNWSLAVNIFVVVSIVGAGLAMYALVRQVSSSALAGFIAAACYVAHPYFLTDIWLRQAQGEVLAFVFFPLVLLGLWRLLTETGNRFQDWWGPASLLGVAAAGLVLSHQLSAALAAVVCVLLVVFNPRALGSPRFWLGIGVAAVLAISLSAVFVLPLWEVWRTGLYDVFDPHSYFNAKYPDQAPSRTIPLVRLFFALPTSVDGHVRTGAGLVVLAGVATALLLIRRLGRSRRLVVQFTVIGLAAVIMASSLIPWGALPRVIWTIQFPFRLLLIVAVTWSAVAGIGFATAAHRLARGDRRRLTVATSVIVAVAFLACTPAWLHTFTKAPLDPGSLSNAFPGGATAAASGEYLPRQLNDPTRSYAKVIARGNQPQVRSGEASISAFRRTGSLQILTIRARSATEVEFGALYYPGFTAELDSPTGRQLLSVHPSATSGMVAVDVPAGTSGVVQIRYGMSPATKLGLGLSVLGLLILATGMILWRVLRRPAEVRRPKGTVDTPDSSPDDH